MAKAKKTGAKKKQPAAVETSASIAEQVEAFLQAGGSIEQVASGVSGQPSVAAKRQAKVSSTS